MMTEPPDPHVESPSAGPDRTWRWALRALVLVPIAVAVGRALINGWFPVGDNALLTVRAADVGTRHHPLLGSWTSASLAIGTDVNNPGPLYSDLIAPFMWTFGRAFTYGAGSAIGVGAVNAAAALATLLVATRVGGWRAERWVLLLVAALAWSMGSELLFDIWQPHALLLPFTLLVVLTAAIATGDLRLLPVWIGVLSVVVQTHIGYAYVGLALASIVVASVAVRVRRTRPLGELLSSSTFRWTAAVAGLAWAQPVWEQLFGDGTGNLQRLATSAGGGELTVGVRTAARLVAAVAVVPPGWTRFGFEDAVPSARLVASPDGPRLDDVNLPGLGLALAGLTVLAAVLAGLWVLLREPAQRLARCMVGISLTLLIVAVGSVAIQVVGVTGLGNHQVRWLFPMAAIAHVSVAWGAFELITARRRRHGHGPVRRYADAALVGLAAVLVLSNLGDHAHALGPERDPAVAATLRGVFRDLAGFQPPEPVVYDLEHISAFEPYSAAVLMRLAELGIDFRIEFRAGQEGHARQYGPSRLADGREPVALRQYERDEAILYAGSGCVVSRRSGLPAAEERALDELMAAAAADIADGTVTVDTAGLADDVRQLVESAAGGDADDALRVVARSLLPVLVAEQRLAATPAINAAIAANEAVLTRVRTALAIVATPARACA